MLKLNKLFSVCISAAMLATALPVMVSAEETTSSPEIVMYENDFSAETVEAALPAVENEYLSFGGYDNIEFKPQLSNGVLTMSQGAGEGGRTLIFDFTKGGTKTGINEGVMYIGYDLAVRGKDDSYGSSKVGVNMSSHYVGGRMIYYEYNGWSLTPYIGEWPGDLHEMDANVHHYENVFDFNAGNAYLYVDGSLAHTWGNLKDDWATVNNYTISMNGDILSFDNLKLSMLNSAKDYSYGFTVNSNKAANGYIDLTFGGVMNTNTGTFKIDDVTVPAEDVQWKSLNEVRLISDTLAAVGTHTVTADVADMLEVAPTQNSVSFETAEGTAVLPETVMYENDFSGSTISEALPAVANEYLTFEGYKADGKAWQFGIEDGALMRNPDAGPDGGWLLFDFTKGGTATGLTINSDVGDVKVMRISYDVALRGEDSIGYNATFIGVNMNSNWDGGRMVKFKGNGYNVVSNFGDWFDNIDHYMDTNVHRYETIFDLANEDAYLYVDGSLVQTWTGYNGRTAITNYSIAINGDIKSFDNLKISKVNKGEDYTYKYTVNSEDAANGYVDLTFGGVMNTTAGTFTIDGVEVPSENVQWKGLSEVRLASDVLKTSGSHTVTAEVTDLYGVAPLKKTVTFATSNELTFDGNTLKATYVNNSGDASSLPVVIVASYDNTGRMTTVEFKNDFTVDGNTATLTYDTTSIEGTVKAFMWNNVNSITPITTFATR